MLKALVALLILTSPLSFADEDLNLRVTMFARAAVADAMRASPQPVAVCDSGKKLGDIEKEINSMEKELDLFLNLTKDRKHEMIAEFKQNLIEKCCRLMHKSK